MTCGCWHINPTLEIRTLVSSLSFWQRISLRGGCLGCHSHWIHKKGGGGIMGAPFQPWSDIGRGRVSEILYFEMVLTMVQQSYSLHYCDTNECYSTFPITLRDMSGPIYMWHMVGEQAVRGFPSLPPSKTTYTFLVYCITSFTTLHPFTSHRPHSMTLSHLFPLRPLMDPPKGCNTSAAD